MPTIIARLTMQEGKETVALEALRKMAAAVQSDEPGALAYVIHRPKDKPLEIVFVEFYADDAAWETHMQTSHMGAFRSSLGELFDLSQTKIEQLKRIEGFVRPELT
jgi:quinol monooxygenase YgiN